MLQGSKPAIFQKSADLRITSKKLETKSIFYSFIQLWCNSSKSWCSQIKNFSLELIFITLCLKKIRTYGKI